MKLQALKNLNWSIDRKATKFSEGEIFDVSDSIARDMLNSGSACVPEDNKAPNKKELVVGSNKAIEDAPKKKVVESAPQNKESEKPKKKVVKKKAVKKKES